MKLSRNREIETWLFDKFRTYLTREERTGIHASDLLSPLLSYWKKKKPLPLTDEECLYFLGGIAHHTMIEAAVSGQKEVSFYDEGTGITYSPDLNDMHGEIKTTRSETIPLTMEEAKRKYAEYIKQCRIYATLSGASVWTLIVYSSSVRESGKYRDTRKPKLRVYGLTFTENELAKERQRLTDLSKDFQEALSTDNPSKLQLCVAWKCYEMIDGAKTGKCPYWDTCLPIGRHPATVDVGALLEEKYGTD